MNDEQLNDANREFELIRPTYADSLSGRLQDGFQIRTLIPGLEFIGPTAYSPPGSAPGQNGPSLVSNQFISGMSGLGDPGSILMMMLNNPVNPSVPNPGTEPPVGPEERLRYSCLSGKCIQDPNGIYYGIDECLADQCGISGGGDSGKGCDCGFGPSHTVFKAQISGITAGPTTVDGKTYWLYSWVEVGMPGTARSSFTFGDAVNEYELSVVDDGDNDTPSTSTVSRKPIPVDSIVDMMLDESGVPWFVEQNPLAVNCVSLFELSLDGGTYVGGPS